MKISTFRKQAQAGFTLIELIVVIVILGILAATALPRMFDMSGQARLAKMQAALGAVKAASASAHAQWLVNGGQLACATCSTTGSTQPGTTVTGEGATVIMLGGYPDVGGDGLANALTTTANSGILTASNLSGGDYVITTLDTALPVPVASKNNITVAADAAHPKCRFTYVEAVQTDAGASQPTVNSAPNFLVSELIPANCN